MNRNSLIASIITLAAGIIGRIYAGNATYVDEAGVLQDSALLPVSTLLILIGVVFLTISVVIYFRNR